jgi:magnesium-transporting ATPase (P-type)
VLSVAMGPPEAVKLAGIIALSDPPRKDSAALITELHTLGVRTVMVTGDAPARAAIVAHAVGLDGAVCPSGPIPNDVRAYGEENPMRPGTLRRSNTGNGTYCSLYRCQCTAAGCV